MELNVLERILLLNILPEQGDYTTLKILRKLRETLSFSEDEHQKLHFKHKYECPQCKQQMMASAPVVCVECNLEMEDTNFLTWESSIEHEKEVHLGDRAREFIVSTLERMDKAKQLTEQHMSLYEKFVEEKEG